MMSYSEAERQRQFNDILSKFSKCLQEAIEKKYDPWATRQALLTLYHFDTFAIIANPEISRDDLARFDNETLIQSKMQWEKNIRKKEGEIPGVY